jgi:hypothetical protein
VYPSVFFGKPRPVRCGPASAFAIASASAIKFGPAMYAGMQWREAGELSYLAIRLLDFVAALPTGTLPPRGRVPWSVNELTELGCLAHVGARGVGRIVLDERERSAGTILWETST